MEDKKYSKVIKFNGKDFRYNYQNAWLEFIWELEDGKVEMLDAIGLSKEDWETGSQHWVEIYDMNLEEELSSLMASGI